MFNQFCDIIPIIRPDAKLEDFWRISHIRRLKIEREGFLTDHIDWDHYARVLHAKHAKFKESLKENLSVCINDES
jgi:hypothetical protein